MAWDWNDYGDYVSAEEKRRRAGADARKLEKKGRKLAPVHLTGRSIANSFWGKAWCNNLESYSDYASRLPRGRSYLRQGAVLDLQIGRGSVKAVVSGTRLYEVAVGIDTLSKAAWTRLKQECAGQVGSLIDLLQGKLSASVMEIVTRKETGLFPKPGEIHLECSCPDWADLCKHVAAVLYGVGTRLDESPELLFTLRGIDHLELIATAARSVTANLAAPGASEAATLDDGSLAEIFGVEIEATLEPAAPAGTTRAAKAARVPAKKASVTRGARKQASGAATKKTPSLRGALKSVPSKGTTKKSRGAKAVPAPSSKKRRPGRKRTS